MCNKILYKYRAISEDDRNGINCSFTKNLLVNGELYFSKFSELNDPNEAIFDYSEDIHIAVQDHEISNFTIHTYVEKLSDGRHHIIVDGRNGARHIRNRLNNQHGILCLTTDNQNSLMFDYYAAGHSGICVGFEWRNLKLLCKRTENYQQQEFNIVVDLH